MKTTHLAKALMSFVLSTLMAVMFASVIAPIFEVDNPLPIALGIVAMPVIIKMVAFALNIPVSMQPGMLFMAVQKETWVDYIIGNLFKNNEFINYSFDESDNVLSGSVVHIPQAGAKPDVVKNRSSFPATAVQRTDTDVTYPLDVFTSDPTHITDAEQKEISYNKIDSALGEHMSAINEAAADEILYKWSKADSAYTIRTTGADSADSLSDGATGTRRKLTKEDLKAAQKLMNKAKILPQDRYALIPEDLFQELMDDEDLKKRDFGAEMSIKEGGIPRLYGFNLLRRSDTTIFDDSATPLPKAPGAASAVDDNQAVICWQKNSVAKAVGTVDFFENIKDAMYYGDVYSAQVKCGGRIRRDDGKGVVVIVQDPTPATP
jgi:hypothetical protein